MVGRRFRIWLPVFVLVFSSNAFAQESSAVLWVYGFFFTLPLLVLGLLVWAIMWLWRGKNSEATQQFLHERDNESQAGRVGE
jgi:hypothetical protein